MIIKPYVWPLTLVCFLSQLAGQIHPSTYTLGRREGGRLHAWVFFTHKPLSSVPALDRFIIAEKALLRRQIRGGVNDEIVSEGDRPVSLEFVLKVKSTGAVLRRVSRWLNAVSVSATQQQLEELGRLSFVTKIQPVRKMASSPAPPIPQVQPLVNPQTGSHQLSYGASEGQLALINVPALHDLGYTGRGITVLMLDTGFFKAHEAISPARIAGEYDFLNNDRDTQNETEEEDLVGQHSHGTATYTALGGYRPGFLIGPAFECTFLLAKTESVPDEYPAEEDNYVAGLEWGEALGADIVSSSLGYLDWYTYDSLDGLTAVTTRAVRWATQLGMLVVTAAGNERNNNAWGGYIIAPADADGILTVGAVTASGALASFSSHGPTFDGRIKPEVAAQGTNVWAGAAFAPDAYGAYNGTSLSTPLVAGSAALLLQAHPTWRPEDVRTALMLTASQAGQPDNDLGWGIINVLAALSHVSTPKGFVAEAGDSTVFLNWQPNTVPDLSHYALYLSTAANFTPAFADSVRHAGKFDTGSVIGGLIDGTTYYFRIAAIDNAGNRSGYSSAVSATPGDFLTVGGVISLTDVYPNPYTQSSGGPLAIHWRLRSPRRVDVDIYDLLGRHVARLMSGVQLPPTDYLTTWMGKDKRGRSVASGIYFVRLTAGRDSRTQRIIIWH